MQVFDEGDDEEEDVLAEVSYRTRPPNGSRYPPEEFRHKMDDIREHYESCPYGMFNQPLYTYTDLPCSLHFETSNNSMALPPSQQAIDAMQLLERDLLGNVFGKKEGCYGGGGGGIHILYIGRYNDTSTNILSIYNLLDMLHLSEMYQPQTMQWMLTTDPLHQQLFPKRNGDPPADDHEVWESIASLTTFVDLLETKIPTKRILTEETVPSHVIRNYPCLSTGKVLFLLPKFASIHDGDCLSSPTFCPAATAFQNRQNRTESWSQYLRQHHSEINQDVILEDTTARYPNGVAMEAGDIYQSPVLCIFQLEATNELLALVQWDYRD